ncbi:MULTISPECIES: hypothetical protein [Streptomyces]|nr:hypothetical protein [Streptomyces sp. AS58]
MISSATTGADEIVLNVTGVAAKFDNRVALTDLQTMLADISQAGSSAAQ